MIYILDTSALLSGKPLDFDGDMVTVPSVEKEMKKRRGDYIIFVYLKEKGLKIFKPSEEHIAEVEKLAEKKGEEKRLSDTDKELIALALELSRKERAILVTDDYSIQNIADFFGIEYMGISQRGISKRFIWMYRCRGCGKIFKRYVASCPVCGSSLRTFVKFSRDARQ